MNATRRLMIALLGSTLWVTVNAGPVTAQAVPQGVPFAVNATAAGDQELPAVAATRDGGFAVVWLTREAGLEGVVARLLDPLGQPLGDEIVLEAPQGAERIRWPRIEARREDEVVAAWFQNPGSIYVPGPVKLRRFDLDGTILGDLESPEEDDGAGQPPLEHDLAAFDDGRLVLTWRQGPDDAGATNEQIYARVYDPAGEPGPEFMVNPDELYYGPQGKPSVAAGGGEFVVVWDDGGDGQVIGFRRYSAEGDALGPEQILGEASPTGEQSEPRVAADADGNFVVTWTERADPLSDLDVWARRFARRGNAASPVAGEAFRVNSAKAGDQQAPDVAMDADGNFVIVWRNDVDGGASLVEGRLFQRFALPVGNSFLVAGGAAPDARPSVALTGSGRMLVVWHAPDVDAESTGIAGRRYSAGFSLCTEDSRSRCLQQDRFRVEVAWRDFAGTTGAGRPVPYRSADSGLFWFFSPSNWELMVKVLDGCHINGSFWVFAAATTNVEYKLTVTDTLTGKKRDYVNPLGVASAAVTDTTAFATCTAVQ